MKKLPKCDNCGAVLSSTNSVLIRINRYDVNSIHCKSLMFCCDCWDSMRIMKDGKEIF